MKKHSGGMSISPSAVHAMIDHIDLFLEQAMPQITDIAKAHGCKKTIKEHEDLEHPEKSQAHVTWFFSIANNRVDAITQMKNKRCRWVLVKNEKGKGESP